MESHVRTTRPMPAETWEEEYLLRRAARDLEECERQLAETVSEALVSGVSWERIEIWLGDAAPAARSIDAVVHGRAS